MAHQLFENRMYSLRVSPWHRLGIVSQEDQDVFQVAERVGIPDISLEEITSSGINLEDYRAIISSTGSCFGVVSPYYQLVSHKDFINIWGQNIPASVETLGLLNKGETLFVTAKLPAFMVKGDEFKPYIMAVNTCDGKTAIVSKPCCTRIVCNNTLMGALREFSSVSFDGRHLGKFVKERLTKFLTKVWDAHTGNFQLLQDAYNSLANISISTDEAKKYYSEIYTLPARPDSTNGEIVEKWEEYCLDQIEHRQNCLTLFGESPTRTAATTNNMWGSYNSVVEYEQHIRKGAGARSALFGMGAKRCAIAWDLALQLV